MTAEQRELYFYTIDKFQNELSKISPTCTSPIIAIRQVVKQSMEKYITDYCSKDTKIEDIFSPKDFQQVSVIIWNEITQG